MFSVWNYKVELDPKPRDPEETEWESGDIIYF